jgi:DNA repair protein RecO
MAGEIVKTQGIVLAVYPWSQTSHVVTWLTPDHGPVTTLVKGAVRAKSAFLGQYDLFYRCDLLYYARASGDLHALREVTPRNLRERLRGDWRATALAGYAADLAKDLAPANAEAARLYLEAKAREIRVSSN